MEEQPATETIAEAPAPDAAPPAQASAAPPAEAAAASPAEAAPAPPAAPPAAAAPVTTASLAPPAAVLKQSSSAQSEDLRATQSIDTTIVAEQIKADTIGNIQPLEQTLKGTVPDHVNVGTFGGFIDAHNALQDRCRVMETHVSDVGKRQNWLVDHLQELRTGTHQSVSSLKQQTQSHTDRLNGLDRIEEIHKENLDVMQKRVTDSESIQEKKLRELDQDIRPQVRDLELTFRDLVNKQSELVSYTLPKWQDDLRREIQSLGTDLSQLQKTTSTRDQSLEDKLAASDAARQKSLKELDDRLSGQVSHLVTRASASEEKDKALAEEIQITSRRLEQADSALSTRIDSLSQELRSFIKAELTAARSDWFAHLETNLKRVEDALKQETFERQCSHKSAATQIQELGDRVGTAQNELKLQIEAVSNESRSKEKELRKQIDTKSSKEEVAAAIVRIAKTEESIAELESNLQGTNERLSATTSSILERVQAHHMELTKLAKDEASNARANVRAEEGMKCIELEASLRKEADARSELSNRLNKELEVLRDLVNGNKAAFLAHADQAVDGVVTKLDNVKAAAENLSQDVDDLTRMQEQVEGAMVNLEYQVQGMQRRSGPIDDAQRRLLELEWYLSSERQSTAGNCVSCGRVSPRARSTSAERPWSAGLRGGSSPGGLQTSPVAIGRGLRLQPPHSARCSNDPEAGRTVGHTWRVARVGGGFSYDASDPGQGFPVCTPPVGPGISAARFQRSRAPDEHLPQEDEGGPSPPADAFGEQPPPAPPGRPFPRAAAAMGR